ncbi:MULTISPECIES: hypothetical protein [Cupriavidus]
MRQFFKRIFNRHKSEPTDQAFVADEPMHRWSQEELAKVKNRLESKDPKEFTLEDHQQVVDNLVQRYLPHDATRTEAKWQEVRGKLHAQVEENYQDVLAGKVVEPQWIKENEQRKQEHKTLHSAYEMSLSEFNQIIVPALARFPFASHLEQLHEEVIRHLWLASVPMTSDLLSDVKYQAKDSKDALTRFHYIVVEACSTLRENYEMLQKARSLGYEEVKVHVRQGCKCNVSAKLPPPSIYG